MSHIYYLKSQLQKSTKFFLHAFIASVYLPAFAAETIDLDSVRIVGKRISDTEPVKTYNAKHSSAGTKTETNLLDTPQSITVIPQDLIEDQSVQSISQAIQYTPGVTAAQGEGNREALIFRGNITTGDFFIDGLRDDVQTYRDLYNTDRIEVLKGPNGMVFGRGGAGGAINRVSKQAGWDAVKEITASIGMFNHKRIAGDFGQSINDKIAFRINAVYEDSDSYRNGVNIERFGINPTITLYPGDKTKIIAGIEYFDDKRTADRGAPSVNGPANSIINRRPFKMGDNNVFYGNAKLSPSGTETFAANASIEHAFDNGIDLKNSTRYAKYDKFYQNIFADSAVANNGNFTVRGYVDYTNRENLINQTDLMVTLNWGKTEHKLLAGLELASQKTDNSRQAAFFNNNFLTTGTQLTLNANNATQILDSTPVTFKDNFINNNNAFRNNQSTVNVIGLYVQDQIKLSEKWQAIVGLRHDRFSTDFAGIRKDAASSSTIAENFNVVNNLFSPRAGLIYKPIKTMSVYANYSLAYVPRAGDQLTSLTLANASFAPEKFINYEVGAKLDVNTNLALTTAVYQLQRENIAVIDPNNAAQTILVDGQQTTGIELGITGNVTDNYSVFGGYAYQEGEITKQQGSGANAVLKGAALGQTPKHTFSIWNRYNFNDTWGAALGIVSRSEMFALSPTATQSTILPGYTRLDAAIFAKFSNQLRLQVNIENITNKEYELFAHNNNNITPGSPLSGRATLIYDF